MDVRREMAEMIGPHISPLTSHEQSLGYRSLWVLHAPSLIDMTDIACLAHGQWIEYWVVRIAFEMLATTWLFL